MRLRTPTVLIVAALYVFPAAADPTPAEARIRDARERIERASSGSQRAASFVALAAAHTARGRETGDGSHYDRSLAALAEARAASPSPAELGAGITKVEAWVRLGRHEFAAAEQLALAHVAAHPDDHEAWGLLGDARMELGRMDAAADAYQRMLDLRPGPGAWLRASYWRERNGDLPGALELLQSALGATGRSESEQRAWVLVHIASIQDRLGRSAEAEASLKSALAHFPDYHYALAGLAEHHLAHGRPDAALLWAERSIQVAPHPERWLLLADALRGVGREAHAREAEDTFERGALKNLELPDNENLYLVDFYLDRRPDPERALQIARREAKRRPDAQTLERLARALERNGLAR